MANKKITELQLVGAITDTLNFPVDDTLQTYRATIGQVKTYLAPIYIPDCLQSYLSGSVTHNLAYAFIVSSAAATVGATYTNNAITYTVVKTVSASNLVWMSGSGAPTSNGTLTKASGTGDTAISFSSYRKPIALYVEMVAGGGGGGASNSSGSTGGAGGTTTFGSSLLTCTGGAGGVGGSGSGGGGAGGSATIASPAFGIVLPGNGGAFGMNTASYTSGYVAYPMGGSGGGSGIFGGGAQSGAYSAGSAGATNSGGGGSGGGIATGGLVAGGGGGGGGGLKAFITDPSATYAVAIGVAGTAGSGAGGNAGGAGGSGAAYVFSKYQ